MRERRRERESERERDREKIKREIFKGCNVCAVCVREGKHWNEKKKKIAFKVV